MRRTPPVSLPPPRAGRRGPGPSDRGPRLVAGPDQRRHPQRRDHSLERPRRAARRVHGEVEKARDVLIPAETLVQVEERRPRLGFGRCPNEGSRPHSLPKAYAWATDVLVVTSEPASRTSRPSPTTSDREARSATRERRGTSPRPCSLHRAGSASTRRLCSDRRFRRFTVGLSQRAPLRPGGTDRRSIVEQGSGEVAARRSSSPDGAAGGFGVAEGAAFRNGAWSPREALASSPTEAPFGAPHAGEPRGFARLRRGPKALRRAAGRGRCRVAVRGRPLRCPWRPSAETPPLDGNGPRPPVGASLPGVHSHGLPPGRRSGRQPPVIGRAVDGSRPHGSARKKPGWARTPSSRSGRVAHGRRGRRRPGRLAAEAPSAGLLRDRSPRSARSVNCDRRRRAGGAASFR